TYGLGSRSLPWLLRRRTGESLAEPLLLHLAGHGPRQRVDELHHSGQLEAGHTTPTKRQDVVGGQSVAAARAPYHDRRRSLTPPGRGSSDDRDFLNSRVGLQHRLDLGRVDVLTARDDQVFLAFLDVKRPVLVQQPDVPGVEPAVPKRFGGRFG